MKVIRRLKGEEWRAIEGFPNYLVSNYGRVVRLQGYRCRESRILTLFLTNRKKYWSWNLSLDSKQSQVLVSRLVCRAFHGKAPLGKEHALHRDGDSTNNFYTNLYWGSPKDNKNDSILAGTYCYGTRIVWSKLIPSQVVSIRSSNERNISKLARQFGVHRKTIYDILAGKIWKRIDNESI